MGVSESKQINDIVSKSCNKEVAKIMSSTDNYDIVTISDTVTQFLKAKRIKLKNIHGCDFNIDNIEFKQKVDVASSINSTVQATLQANLTSEISKQISQNQAVKREMGSSAGSFNKTEQDNYIKSIVKNVVESSVSIKEINANITDINKKLTQSVTAKDIIIEDCTYSNVKINVVNINQDAQIKQVSDVVTNMILSSSLLSKLTENFQQTQKLTETGIASVLGALGKMLIPLAIAVVGVVIAFGYIGKGVVTSATNWKLWAVIGILVIAFGITAIVLYTKKIWPFQLKKLYVPSMDKDGLRLSACEETTKQAGFNSEDKCLADVNNPKSAYYWNNFWGFDDKTQSCGRYKDLVNNEFSPDGETLVKSVNMFGDEKTCLDYTNNRRIYVPDYKYNQAVPDFLKTNKDIDCKESSSFYAKDCKQYDLTPGDLSNAIIQYPVHYRDKEACDESVAFDKQHVKYHGNCVIAKGKVTDSTCQYIETTIDNDRKIFRQTGADSDTQYTTADAICAMS